MDLKSLGSVFLKKTSMPCGLTLTLKKEDLLTSMILVPLQKTHILISIFRSRLNNYKKIRVFSAKLKEITLR